MALLRTLIFQYIHNYLFHVLGTHSQNQQVYLRDYQVAQDGIIQNQILFSSWYRYLLTAISISLIVNSLRGLIQVPGRVGLGLLGVRSRFQGIFSYRKNLPDHNGGRNFSDETPSPDNPIFSDYYARDWPFFSGWRHMVAKLHVEWSNSGSNENEYAVRTVGFRLKWLPFFIPGRLRDHDSYQSDRCVGFQVFRMHSQSRGRMNSSIEKCVDLWI